MNPLDSRPSLGACNAAAGLGLAASNWQRAPRPPVRMASAPLLSPSAPHHTLAPSALHQPPSRPAAAAAASPLPRAGANALAPRVAQPAEAATAPALCVSVRGPGPQVSGARTARTPADAAAALPAAGAAPARQPARAAASAPSTTWLAAEPPAPWAARPAQPWPDLSAPAQPAARAAQPARAPRARAGSREVVFEFIGQGALSVLSSITGRCYRFEQPGAQLTVDARDVGQLARVSLLRCLPTAG